MDERQPRRFQFGLRWLLLVFVPVALVALPVGKYLRRPKTVPVTGIVTLNGMPIDGAQVTFFPNAVDGRAAIAMTDMAGEFSLKSFTSGASFTAGALPGSYTIGIEKVANPMLVRYAHPIKSGLTVEVKHDGPNEFVFDLVTP